jgi:hypothetical protein
MASERSWVSPYSYCQNSPVMRVDPTGALDIIDDYFTIEGKYLGSDGDINSNNIRIIDKETYHNLVGINDKDGETLLQSSENSILWNDAEMSDEKRLLVWQHYNETGLPLEIDESLSANSRMAYVVGGYKILIPVNRNKSVDLFNNYFNVKSTFDHEEAHYLDHMAMGTTLFLTIPTGLNEMNAISTQRKSPNYKYTTCEYKHQVEKYLDRSFQSLIK